MNRDYYFLNGSDEDGEEDRVPARSNSDITPEQELNNIVNAAVQEYAERVGLEGQLHVSLVIDDDATHRAKSEQKYILYDIGTFLSDINNNQASEFIGVCNYILARLSLIRNQLAMVQGIDQFDLEEFTRDINEIIKQAHATRINLLKLSDMLNFTAFKAYHKYEYMNLFEEDEDDPKTQTDNDSSSDSPHDGPLQ